MKKNDCNVVRDLMPLVLDRVASDESRALVEEHMGSCEECRKQYEEMKAELPEETRAEYEAEQRNIMEALKATRANQRKRKRRHLIVIFAVVLAAVMAGGMLVTWLNQGYWPVDNKNYTICLSRLKDGSVVMTMDMKFNSSYIGSTGEVKEEDGKKIWYQSIYVPPLRYIHNGENHGKQFWTVIDESMLTDEIRQGKPGDSVTIWKKGDPIPEASEEMEFYFAMEKEKYPDTEISITDLDKARDAVPEWQ